jgi:twinkle protein
MVPEVMSNQVDTKGYPCRCGSSDARKKYRDNRSFCFACHKTFDLDGNPLEAKNFDSMPDGLTPAMIKSDMISRGFRERGITKTITTFFGVKVGYNSEGEIDTHYYPYDGGECYKSRELPKQFSWIKEKGKKSSESLFGKELFNGGGKRIVITEGEIDAMTVAQAYLLKYKKIYPVVGMSSAMMTRSLINSREWLRSFEEIILCLDNDEAGETATNEAVRILGVDKVKIAKLPLKDPNKVFLEKSPEDLLSCIYNAARHIPSGIITKDEIWSRLANAVDTPVIPYPNCLGGLNDSLQGMRFHDIVLIVSGTGCGKSTVVREIELHLRETTEHRIGVIHLEETPEKCAVKLSSMYLNVNPANVKLELDQIKPAFDYLFEDDRLIVLDHQGSMKDGSIIDKLEYMCLMGCKFIALDHLTILVSEGVEGEKGNEGQDRIMSDLLKLVLKYELCIILIAHLRKTSNMQKAFESGEMPTLDDIKGSGALKQIPMDIIGLARDTTSGEIEVRNSVRISILKARETGNTGPTRGTFFDKETGRLMDTLFYKGADIVDLGIGGHVIDSTATKEKS